MGSCSLQAVIRQSSGSRHALITYVVVMWLSGFRQAVIRQSAGSRQAVVMQSSGSWQAVVRQSSGSRQAVIRQSSGSRQAVVRQSSGSRQAVVRQSSYFLTTFSIFSSKIYIDIWKNHNRYCNNLRLTILLPLVFWFTAW
jgi:hypothetical protein